MPIFVVCCAVGVVLRFRVTQAGLELLIFLLLPSVLVLQKSATEPLTFSGGKCQTCKHCIEGVRSCSSPRLSTPGYFVAFKVSPACAPVTVGSTERNPETGVQCLLSAVGGTIDLSTFPSLLGR